MPSTQSSKEDMINEHIFYSSELSQDTTYQFYYLNLHRIYSWNYQGNIEPFKKWNLCDCVCSSLHMTSRGSKTRRMKKKANEHSFR